METFTIKIDFKDKMAKAFYELITNFAELNKFVEIKKIESEQEPNRESLKAIKEGQSNNLEKFSTSKDLIADCLK